MEQRQGTIRRWHPHVGAVDSPQDCDARRGRDRVDDLECHYNFLVESEDEDSDAEGAEPSVSRCTKIPAPIFKIHPGRVLK